MESGAVYLTIMETTTQTATMRAPRRHPLFKWILVFGIAIVTNLFLNYALDAFYLSPKFEVFCPQKDVVTPLTEEKTCRAVGGQWTNEPYKYVGMATPIPVDAPKGYCNENYTCGKNYDDAMKVYNRNVFIVLVVSGTALLIGSIFASAIEAVALGFSFAGILSLIIGTTRYWGNMDDRLRVVVLGLALVALVWIGIKKFKD